MATTEGRVGLKTSSTGNTDGIALTKDTAQFMMRAHHANVEAARSAKTFLAGTGVAGVAPGTALSTTPPLTLYNPQGSGVGLALVRAMMGYVSGTLGKGTIVLGANSTVSQAAPTGGTSLTPRCSFVGYTGNKGLAYEGATLAAAPTLYLPLWILGAWVGAADTALALDTSFDGSLMIAPGASVSLQGIAAAGSSPLVLFAVIWEEVVL